ncbi:MAG: hypothetical protein LBH80_02655 [Prevotellaceae bacterium]|jgi:hypothetical protein|nr:hypothetical protein [Prevotellaceae bacterium]
MTSDNFFDLLNNPEHVDHTQLSDLKELIEKYPYFYQARTLYLKALQQTKSIDFEAEIEHASIYAPDKRWLFYYLYPEKQIEEELSEHTPRKSVSGGYFVMMEKLDKKGGKTKQSLKELAEKLKEAREYSRVQPTTSKKIPESITIQHLDNNVTEHASATEPTEKQVQQLIAEKKYRQAIDVLKELNLNNPKKNTYFADQIRFLEKILENKKIKK